MALELKWELETLLYGSDLSLHFASSNLSCSESPEFLETSLLRSLRTPKILIRCPLPSALVSPARTGGEKRIKFGKSQLLPCPKLFHKAAALTSCKSNC